VVEELFHATLIDDKKASEALQERERQVKLEAQQAEEKKIEAWLVRQAELKAWREEREAEQAEEKRIEALNEWMNTLQGGSVDVELAKAIPKLDVLLPTRGYHICQGCQKFWVIKEVLCEECQNTEKKKYYKGTLELGVAMFAGLSIILAVIILIVSSIVGYLRFDGFSPRFFQLIGAWIGSVIIFLFGVLLLIPYDVDLASLSIKQNSKYHGLINRLDGIVQNILALYDMEELSITVEDIIALLLYLPYFAIFIIGSVGVVGIVVFLVSNNWELSGGLAILAGVLGFRFVWILVERACYDLGEMERTNLAMIQAFSKKMIE
jgi:hypothetical protein